MLYTASDVEKPLENLVPDGGFCAIFRRFACIGDSLSSGEHESLMDGKTDYHDYFEFSWGQFMARTCGSVAFNLSRGGMTAKEYHDFAAEKGFWGEEYLADAYIVALGVNDVTWAYEGIYHATLGSFADVDWEDYTKNAPTFAGDYAKILQRVRELQPHAPLFLVTMPFDRNHSADLNARMDAHRDLLYKFAEKLPNTYVLDFRRYAPDYGTEEFHKMFYMGMHLNAAGYLYTSKLMMSYIDYVVRHNPDAFSNVGFIGKPDGLHNESRPF